MHNHVMFLDCPGYMDEPGEVRCGLPAEVQSRYTAGSTGGPLEAARISCPRGHWFNGPIEALSLGHVLGPSTFSKARRSGGKGTRHR